MTARPLDSDRWRKPASAAAVLVLLLAMAMAAGCISGGKEVRPPEDGTPPVPVISALTTMIEKPNTTAINISGTDKPVSRNSSCQKISYEPVFILGDRNMTRFLGHETKSTDSGMTLCTEFNSSYTIQQNLIPVVITKFDFVEFDQPQIISTIGRNKEIDVWIRGEKHTASLRGMNFTAEDTGIHSFSGSLEGISQNKVILTVSNRATLGSVIHEKDTFYLTPVGSRKDAEGNFSIVYIVYNQQDVEPHSFSLANDVITPTETGIPVRYYEST